MGVTPRVCAAAPEVRAEVARAIEAANAQLSRVEQVRRWALLDREWLPGGDELTPTMKLKRKFVNEKYIGVIDGMYAEAG